MVSDSYRDIVLAQLDGLTGLRCMSVFGDGWLYFRTNLPIFPEFLVDETLVSAPSERQVLQEYHEVIMDILQDSASLLLWLRRGAG
jgi:hypothetical protein